MKRKLGTPASQGWPWEQINCHLSLGELCMCWVRAWLCSAPHRDRVLPWSLRASLRASEVCCPLPDCLQKFPSDSMRSLIQ